MQKIILTASMKQQDDIFKGGMLTVGLDQSM